VGFVAAHVALYRSARIKGYKLSREGADLKSLCGGVCVLSKTRPPLGVAPASPFIVSKGRARVTFVVKR
jgi:hypothetical protein